MNFSLHPKQSVAFLSPATEILYGGAAGGGKSHLLRVKAVFLASQIPHLQVYLIRRTATDLLKNHFEGPTGFPSMLAEWIKAGICKDVYSPSAHIRFSNGSAIHVGHCQHKKDLRKYQGPEIHVLLIDELTHFPEEFYRFIRSRTRMPKDPEMLQAIKDLEKRSGIPINLPLIICGSNPGSIGHNWVKQTWVTSQQPLDIVKQGKKEGGKVRQFIPALLPDNPSLDPEEYAASLEGLGNPYLVKAMLKGSWDIVAGGMFDDLWNPEKHIVRPFPIPKSWRVDRSFDWGSSKPFSVGWWAESDGCDLKLKDGTIKPTIKGDLFRFAELYGWNGKANTGCKMLAADVAKKINAIEKRFPFKVHPGPADSSIFTTEDGHCIADNMSDEGIEWEHANKSPGSRIAGWELIRNFLKGAVVGESPGVYVWSTCLQFIRTIPVLPRDTIQSDDVDTDSEDHIADEFRYRLLTKPNIVGSGSVIGLG